MGQVCARQVGVLLRVRFQPTRSLHCPGEAEAVSLSQGPIPIRIPGATLALRSWGLPLQWDLASLNKHLLSTSSTQGGSQTLHIEGLSVVREAQWDANTYLILGAKDLCVQKQVLLGFMARTR